MSSRSPYFNNELERARGTTLTLSGGGPHATSGAPDGL